LKSSNKKGRRRTLFKGRSLKHFCKKESERSQSRKIHKEEALREGPKMQEEMVDGTQRGAD